jgi:hypothetical protein
VSPLALVGTAVPACIAAWAAFRYRTVLASSPNFLPQLLAGLVLVFGQDKRSHVDQAMEVLRLLCGANPSSPGPGVTLRAKVLLTEALLAAVQLSRFSLNPGPV